MKDLAWDLSVAVSLSHNECLSTSHSFMLWVWGFFTVQVVLKHYVFKHGTMYILHLIVLFSTRLFMQFSSLSTSRTGSEF